MTEKDEQQGQPGEFGNQIASNPDPNQTIFLLGDRMVDEWRVAKIKKLNPEQPGGVVIEELLALPCMQGGAGNVEECLNSLGIKVVSYKCATGRRDVKTRWVTKSGRILARVDISGIYTPARLPNHSLRHFKAVVVSDYAKGSITPEVKERLWEANQLFVDCKDPKGYPPWATFFPNRTEYPKWQDTIYPKVVLTMGEEGAKEMWQGGQAAAATNPHPMSVCGAGDVVMAGYVWASLTNRENPLEDAMWLAGRACSRKYTCTIHTNDLEGLKYARPN